MRRARRPPSAASSAAGIDDPEVVDAAGSAMGDAAGVEAAGAEVGAEVGAGVGAGIAGPGIPEVSRLLIEPEGGGIVGSGEAGTVAADALGALPV
ncbi:hypothetical protein [Salinibacterium sp. M195]|uniref:hypothetical protein n=1 Tax=Salinibacterium sp. M195 TaxID=2583374 RepID=UPI001C62CC67|nr:hypothetical protein [Salinibacterium sp. M195]QYH35323.1 hypothetical protein FFT87_04800 [Salinibacterium sp. M195]